MVQRYRVLLAAFVVFVVSAPPHSSFAQECDGDYYTGIGASQNHNDYKRQSGSASLLKHRVNQQQPKRAIDAAAIESRASS